MRFNKIITKKKIKTHCDYFIIVFNRKHQHQHLDFDRSISTRNTTNCRNACDGNSQARRMHCTQLLQNIKENQAKESSGTNSITIDNHRSLSIIMYLINSLLWSFLDKSRCECRVYRLHGLLRICSHFVNWSISNWIARQNWMEKKNIIWIYRRELNGLKWSSRSVIDHSARP